VEYLHFDQRCRLIYNLLSFVANIPPETAHSSQQQARDSGSGK